MGSLWTGLQACPQAPPPGYSPTPCYYLPFYVELRGPRKPSLPHEKASVPENGHCTAPVCEGSYPASLGKKASFCIKLCSPIFGQDLHHLPQGFLRVYHEVGKNLLDAKEILVEVIPLLSLSKLYYISWRRVFYSVTFSASSPGSASLRRRI
jgi:hypothetical protein